jgi:hypothetical protein
MELLHLQARRHVDGAPRFAAEIALQSRRLARADEGARRGIASGREDGRQRRLSEAEGVRSAQGTGARAVGA